MDPTKWPSTRKSERMEQREETHSTGKTTTFFKEFGMRRKEEVVKAKMGEIRRRMFEWKEGSKSKWWFCEECFDFTKERDRGIQCTDNHARMDTRTLKLAYKIDDTKTMRDYLMAVRRDVTGRKDVEEEVPLIGRKTLKKMAIWRRKEVQGTIEDSVGTTRGEEDERQG
jgi:hypothetical protein